MGLEPSVADVINRIWAQRLDIRELEDQWISDEVLANPLHRYVHSDSAIECAKTLEASPLSYRHIRYYIRYYAARQLYKQIDALHVLINPFTMQQINPNSPPFRYTCHRFGLIVCLICAFFPLYIPTSFIELFSIRFIRRRVVKLKWFQIFTYVKVKIG